MKAKPGESLMFQARPGEPTAPAIPLPSYRLLRLNDALMVCVDMDPHKGWHHPIIVADYRTGLLFSSYEGGAGTC